MKKIIISLMLLFAVSSLHAQTFIVANNDGVEIQYTVVDDIYVKVVANDYLYYSGRVIVPSTVTYEGVTYTVRDVAPSAFAFNPVTYVELPETIQRIGAMAFDRSDIDTLYLKCMFPPFNQSGGTPNDVFINGIFGTQLCKTVTVVVPAGALVNYRYTSWSVIPNLTSPSAVPVTLYAPKAAMLQIINTNLKVYNETAAYFTRFFEVGERVWIAAYHNDADTLFLGWDKGGVFLTEITGPDTLRPVFDAIGNNMLAVNNVSTPIKFTGQLSYLNGQANYYVPANSSSSPLFSTGLWMSGIDTANRYAMVRASKYSCAGDYVPGPLSTDGQLRSDLETRRAFNRVWVVSREEIDDFIAHVGSEGYSIPENILSWPGNGGEGYAEQLAPYYDADNDGLYNPHHGDYPLIKGDRMAFSIFNDVVASYQTGSDPMGFEIHMSAYAFDEPQDTALNNTVFVSYKIINRSNNVYVDSYLGAFTDFDIGYGYDDFIGCDVRAGMAYGYNGIQVDQNYPDVPPAQGCIMLAGPFEDPDNLDNPIIDIAKMQTYYPEQLAGYLLPDGSYDTLRLNADADLYYPDAWNYADIYYDASSDMQHNPGAFINGLNYGNGIVDDERMGMCKFLAYENSNNSINGDPTGFNAFYCYLHGRWKNNEGMLFGNDGVHSGTTNPLHCSFMFPFDSDPLHWGTGRDIPDTNPNNWVENNVGNTPGDRRGIQSSGPFIIEVGEVNTLDLAFTTAFGTTSPWSSVEKLRQQALDIRRQFARDTTDSGRPFTYMPYSAPIAGINEQPTANSQLSIYPNPAHDLLSVALGDGNPANIDIFDIRGNKVLSIPSASGFLRIDISSLPKGIYILRSASTVSRFVKL
jgi:hypothetical protein